MQFLLHSVSWSWLKYVTVHKFTVADSFSFSQFNSSSMSLRWDCASKVPYGKWRWLSIKMMLSFASISPTNAIVKPFIIVRVAFVSVSLLLRWKLRADSSLESGSLKKNSNWFFIAQTTQAASDKRYGFDNANVWLWLHETVISLISPILHDVKTRIQLGVSDW